MNVQIECSGCKAIVKPYSKCYCEECLRNAVIEAFGTLVSRFEKEVKNHSDLASQLEELLAQSLENVKLWKQKK